MLFLTFAAIVGLVPGEVKTTPVHFARAAHAERRNDLVGAEPGARGKGHA
jgi:hypothetical protein